MTDNEIIKALECCSVAKTPDDCERLGCPCFSNPKICIFSDENGVILSALSLINRQKSDYEDLQEQFRHLDIECERLEKANERQKAEIEKLQHRNSELDIELKAMRGAANSYKADGERLQDEMDKQYEIAEANVRAEIASGGTSCHWCEDKVKADAIKEFDERLKEDCLDFPLEDGDVTMLVDVDSYNNLVKEMVGDDNG